jgi:hypothetical protein
VSFEYRVHDTRLGKFLSIDPLVKDYPWNSPYAFSENRVIDAIELEGAESVKYTYSWNPKKQAYDLPMKLGLFPSIPKSGALHEWVGGPDIADGYDKRVIYRPGPWAIAPGFDKQVKSAKTVVKEFSPYVSATVRSSSGGNIEMDKGPIGVKVGTEFVENQSTLTLGIDGISLTNKGLYQESTIGANVMFGGLKVEATTNSDGKSRVRSTMLDAINIESNYGMDGSLETSKIHYQKTLGKKSSGGITNKFSIQVGLQRKGDTMKDTKEP